MLWLQKRFMNIVYCSVLVVFSLLAEASPFQNLDFQSPHVGKLLSSDGSVRDIIPGWQLQLGGQYTKSMFYNDVCISCPSAQLLGPKVPRIGGTFTFTMGSGVLLDGYDRNMGAASIYQVGQVPESAKSIHFNAIVSRGIENLHVSLDGRLLELLRFPNGDSGGLPGYEADVSIWAGMTAELRFTFGPGTYPHGVGGPLAAIQFSSIPVSAIPEPSTWALLIMGLGALAWSHCRCGLNRV